MSKKKSKMLSAYSIVFIFLIITAILTWFVPTSVVVSNHGVKEVIYNASFGPNGEVLQGAGYNRAGIWDIIMAP
ncbi:MAG: YfcC family protein, partial [Cetobacterium sp.]|nr:YfcC family protein [Cetobacterium sp.]